MAFRSQPGAYPGALCTWGSWVCWTVGSFCNLPVQGSRGLDISLFVLHTELGKKRRTGGRYVHPRPGLSQDWYRGVVVSPLERLGVSQDALARIPFTRSDCQAPGYGGDQQFLLSAT